MQTETELSLYKVLYFVLHTYKIRNTIPITFDYRIGEAMLAIV